MNLEEQRRRALNVLQSKKGIATPLEVDYIIDSQCRELLGLPERPNATPPYTGWLIGDGKSKAPVGRISEEGVAHVKRWEGLRTNAYYCPAGVLTIGYGHTKTVKPGMMISHQEAEQLLREDLKVFERAVRKLVKVPLNQGQFDALVSFTFNVGVHAFGKSTLLRKLNEGKYKQAAFELHRWVHAGRRRLPGLVARRNEEHGMFHGE